MSDEHPGKAGGAANDGAKGAAEQIGNAAAEVKAKAGQAAGKVVDLAKETTRDVGDSVQGEIASLREQVKKLMDERVTPGLNQAAETASAYGRRAQEAATQGADAASEAVRENPLAAMGLALSIGVVLGWAISGRSAPPPWYSMDRYR